MVRHVFAWRVASGYEQNEIVELLNTLPSKLDAIKGWQVGSHQGEPGDNGDPWDGVLISDFDSWDALESYSNDPIHLKVVELLKPMFAARAVIDYEVSAH